MKPAIKRMSVPKKNKTSKFSKIFSDIQIDFILQFTGNKPVSAFKLIHDLISEHKSLGEFEIKITQSSIKGIESGASYTIIYSCLFMNKKFFDSFTKLIIAGKIFSNKENTRKITLTKVSPIFSFVVPVYLKFYEKGIEDNVNLSNQLNGLLFKDFQLFTNLAQPIISKTYDGEILKGKDILAFRGQDEVVKDKLVTPEFIDSLKCFTSKVLELKNVSVYEKLKKAFGVWTKI